MRGRSAAPPEPTAAEPPKARRQPPPAEEPSRAPAPAAAPERKSGEPAPSSRHDSFIPDDLDLGREELPGDFWDSPAPSEPPVAAQAAESGPPQAPIREPAPLTEDPAQEAEGTASELEVAFNQLQSLFPGRVVEVRPHADEEPPETEIAPLDDEAAAGGGYDDEDQDQLSFGPNSA